ncbi:MAG: DUF167 domain-containing protein [Betaproteobacteria bacterium]|nr:DUF167 domain-containing protein [Betaproteobacteria bacterium]
MRTLRIRVKPNARVSLLTQQEDGTWIAQIAAAPVDGKANVELIALIARHFGVRKSQIAIKSGAGASIKQVVLDE